ncbi:MAG: winged helix-turn-helix domain-containing protein [Acidobacteria bacterium]|nr:winged helix-turn-helix domain-containing protein [Acidobacteriota bacterium]
MVDLEEEIYEFDGFRIDISERRLSNHGAELAVTPKAFDLLALLVRNHGHLLTKDRIIEELWPGSFVEEANLNVNISALRRILGDTAAEQRFIETVPRQAYRFVANADRLEPREEVVRPLISRSNGETLERKESKNIGEDILRALRRAKRRRMILSAVAAFAVLSFPFAGWLVYRSLGTGDHVPKSIAVLPFRPLSQSSSDEALELGMTDALITKLSKIDRLTVRPTSAVRKYATQYSDALEAGRELRVEAVLDGKVQKADNKVRVSVQLLRVADGVTLWSGSFDDFFTNIFALQDSISERMATSLAVKLSRREQDSIEKRYTENTEAYQLFLQAQFHHLQISEAGSRNALRYYEAAVAKDPDYALAWASMVGAYAHLENLNDDREANRERARNAAYRALAIDPELPEAHEAVATVVDFFEWNWPEAEKEYLKAIELGPNRDGPHYAYSIFLSRFKRHDEAVREIMTARQIDPSAVYIQDQLVHTLLRARRSDDALAEANKSLEMKPDGHIVSGLLVRIFLQTSKFAEAEAVLDRMKEVGTPLTETLRARLYLNTGRRAEAEKILRPLIANYKEGDSALPIALNHLRLGETDQAFQFLEKAYQRRESQVMIVNIEPEWDVIRGDARYADLMRRMRVPL